MLGSMVFDHLTHHTPHTIWGTLRAVPASFQTRQDRLIQGVEAHLFESIVRAILACRPQVVINCIGIVKQGAKALDAASSIEINSLLPHRLADICTLVGARLVHISTDCVFSGRKDHPYTQEDQPDAHDLYGRSKLLGEVTAPPHLTLRTSIIGHELAGKQGLLEWFLSCTGKVPGYLDMIFSGLTTFELAKVLAQHILPKQHLSGLYHVASSPICKYDLLALVQRRYGLAEIQLEAVPGPKVNRALDGTSFAQAAGYQAPDWPTLIDDMFLNRGPHVHH
jgi:dTDP-4-dehydrorhamnose reductase